MRKRNRLAVSAGTTAIKLTPPEVQSIDEALEAMPMSDVFRGSAIRA